MIKIFLVRTLIKYQTHKNCVVSKQKVFEGVQAKLIYKNVN